SSFRSLQQGDGLLTKFEFLNLAACRLGKLAGVVQEENVFWYCIRVVGLSVLSCCFVDKG
ncbi:hypothetical protein EMPG_11919, partial [Blastomyces silverae]